jgi:anti-sigma B factor antagonist
VQYYFCEFPRRLGSAPDPPGADTTADEGWPLSAEDPITTSVVYRDSAAVVSVGGEIDLSTAPAFEEAITEALEHSPSVLAIELSAVTFMASVGLRILAATNERVGEITRIAIVADNAAASRPIQLTGLDSVVPLYPSLDAALTASD